MKFKKHNLFPVLVLIISTVVFSNYLLQNSLSNAQKNLEANFNYLSRNGNSSCGGSFTASLDIMANDDSLKGSCCSPMDFHRYSEQIAGLKKYKRISEIPSDPYNIDVALAKKLKSYYDFPLSAKEQQHYDYAMVNSHEKGPCCCKCWRWYVYGGLAKYLIHQYGFSGEQVVDVWNLSDGCGGGEEHSLTLTESADKI